MPPDQRPASLQNRSHSPDWRSRDDPTYRRRSKSPAERTRRSGAGHEHKKRKKDAELDSAKRQKPRPHFVALPFSSASLSKHQLGTYRPLFASYLDIQKQLDIDDLSEHELKGRWKSFVGKWNRGELAEGWYDPATLTKATEARADITAETDISKNYREQFQNFDTEKPLDQSSESLGQEKRQSNQEDDDDYGPDLPPASFRTLNSASRLGPTIPTTSDLALRDELDEEDRVARREELRSERRAERGLQRQRDDELQPRAEPGTRERRLEKRQETAASNRSFAEARGKGEGGVLADVGDGELMGSEGGAEEVKAMRQREERKKNERELRREEVLRARAAEREERLAGLKEREEQTMSMLRAIAKERFG